MIKEEYMDVNQDVQNRYRGLHRSFNNEPWGQRSRFRMRA